MKWTMLFLGFVLYAVFATIVAGWLMHSQTHSSYGDAVAFLVASVIGLVFGLVGMCSGYYVYKKEYVGAASMSILLTFLVAIVFATIFLAL